MPESVDYGTSVHGQARFMEQVLCSCYECFGSNASNEVEPIQTALEREGS